MDSRDPGKQKRPRSPEKVSPSNITGASPAKKPGETVPALIRGRTQRNVSGKTHPSPATTIPQTQTLAQIGSEPISVSKISSDAHPNISGKTDPSPAKTIPQTEILANPQPKNRVLGSDSNQSLPKIKLKKSAPAKVVQLGAATATHGKGPSNPRVTVYKQDEFLELLRRDKDMSLITDGGFVRRDSAGPSTDGKKKGQAGESKDDADTLATLGKDGGCHFYGPVKIKNYFCAYDLKKGSQDDKKK